VSALVLNTTVVLSANGQTFAAWQMYAAFSTAHHIFGRGFILTLRPIAPAAPQTRAHDPIEQQGTADQQQIFAHAGIAFKRERGSLPQSVAGVEYGRTNTYWRFTRPQRLTVDRHEIRH
jgi:hypothetical protein